MASTASTPSRELEAAGSDAVDRIERVPFGDRWVPDAFDHFKVPGGFGAALVDMTQVKKAVRILRDAKIPATVPHLIVRAIGIFYARNRGNVRFLYNYRRVTPASLDVGLSMAGQTAYAPVVVIHAVDRKPLSVLVPSIIAAVDEAAAREEHDLAVLRKWVVPFRWLRHWMLGILHRSFKWRTQIVGHFQVTCLSTVDIFVPLVFYSNSILGVGAVRDRVVVSDGKPVVRPTVWLSGVADHAATDGQSASDAFQVVREILEGEELVTEAREAAMLAARANGAESKRLGPGAGAMEDPPPARQSPAGDRS
jgi:2-oxoacid dehydrogenases acyltransferase (catalytic domain)